MENDENAHNELLNLKLTYLNSFFCLLNQQSKTIVIKDIKD